MAKRTSQSKPTVIVIDDDESVREALRGLFKSVGLSTEVYPSVQAFDAAGRPDPAGCMVLDIRLPGQSGLDFQETLIRAGECRSVILISGHADVPMSVRAMKAGAIEVLTKPVREQELLEAVQRAIAHDAGRRAEMDVKIALEARVETLTERERQVMVLVVTGMPNKQIASAIGVTEATVKLHRGQVMRKMEAESLVELVRMADFLGWAQPKSALI